MPPMSPYTYIQCPCSDPATTAAAGVPDTGVSPTRVAAAAELDEDDKSTFDPRAPRANYGLYPIEHLLYCEDCHQIRCPRCVAEEIVTYYCPSCLFEVPSSNIKSEGNRCTRSCFQCPICIGTLAVTSLEAVSSSSHLTVDNSETQRPLAGPYILVCTYCYWASTEIGLHFDKPNGLYAQLQKLRNGGYPRLTPKERKERRKDSLTAAASSSGSGGRDRETEDGSNGGSDEKSGAIDDELDIETQFANLKSFYQTQLANTASGGVATLSSLGDLGFSSPGSLSRIMSLYTGGGSLVEKRHKRAGVMREALNADEGLGVLAGPVPSMPSTSNGSHSSSNGHNASGSNYNGNGNGSSSSSSSTSSDNSASHDTNPAPNFLDESAAIAHLQQAGWQGTTTAEQRANQPPNLGVAPQHGASRLADELRPIPVLLRTKRSKRCPMCRHIMTKPESKVASTRFRIRLVAGSYIPSISVRRHVVKGGGGPGDAGGDDGLLTPLTPAQYLLTFRNPIFERVRVSLATPSSTPGRFASTVTLLCPQFEIGANTDVWDEALKENGGGAAAAGGGDRTSSSSAAAGAQGGPSSTAGGGGGSGSAASSSHQAELGKIWERGRNWVSIVVEVVPASLRLDLLGLGLGLPSGEQHLVDRSPLKEDEDLLEIPVFVRVEWEADAAGDEVGHAPGRDRDAKERRELAYWCVIGLGRIRQN